MMNKMKTIGIFLVLLLFIRCGGAGIHGNAPKTYDNVKEMTTDIKAGVENISIAEIKALFESDEMFILIDVRERSEFE